MSLFFSILKGEFIRSPRQNFFYIKRMFFAIASSIILVLVYIQQTATLSQALVLSMFEWMTLFLIIAQCIISPYMAAADIIKEKENGTLNLLILTDISSNALMFAKTLMISLKVAVFYLSVTPLMILCVSMGGISMKQVFAAVLLMFCSSIIGISFGFLLAGFLDKEAQLQKYLAIASCIFFAIPPITTFLLGSMFGLNYEKTLTIISPILAMYRLSADMHYQQILINCGLNIIIAIPLLLVGFRIITKRHGIKMRLKNEEIRSSINQIKPISKKPIEWKEENIHIGSERMPIQKILVQNLIMFAIIFSIIIAFVLISKKSIFNTGIIFICFLILQLNASINLLVVAISRISKSFSDEKDNKTMEILLLSDLSSVEIIKGKMKAIINSLKPWFWVYVISSILMVLAGLINQLIFQFSLVIAIIMLSINFILMLYSYLYIQLYYSLNWKLNRTSSSIAGFMVWYFTANIAALILGLLLALPTAFLSLPILFFATPLIALYYYRKKLIQDFRAIALS